MRRSSMVFSGRHDRTMFGEAVMDFEILDIAHTTKKAAFRGGPFPSGTAGIIGGK
jgi:hypothetical protein